MDLDETAEAILQELQSAANYMRGMSMDTKANPAIKVALLERANRIDKFVESYNRF